MSTACHWTQWAQESRSSGLLHSPCGAFGRGAWQRVITHTHTLCASHVCLFASRRAGWSILQGCNQGRLCNQYHHSELENVLRAHSTLRSQREKEKERTGKKIQQEIKQMQGGTVQMFVNLSRLANKQCFSVIIHKTALIALYHLTYAPCLSATGCSGLSIIQLEAHWLMCEWVDLVQKAERIIYRPLH